MALLLCPIRSQTGHRDGAIMPKSQIAPSAVASTNPCSQQVHPIPSHQVAQPPCQQSLPSGQRDRASLKAQVLHVPHLTPISHIWTWKGVLVQPSCQAVWNTDTATDHRHPSPTDRSQTRLGMTTEAAPQAESPETPRSQPFLPAHTGMGNPTMWALVHAFFLFSERFTHLFERQS